MAKIYRVEMHSEDHGWMVWYYNSLAEAKKFVAYRSQGEDVTITNPIEACEKPTTQRGWMEFLNRLSITR